jgi:hypothetical protein
MVSSFWAIASVSWRADRAFWRFSFLRFLFSSCRTRIFSSDQRRASLAVSTSLTACGSNEGSFSMPISVLKQNSERPSALAKTMVL